MRGEYSRSRSQELVFSLGHAVIVAAVIWLLLAGGLARVGLDAGGSARRVLLAAASGVYLLRFLATTFVFIRRSMDLPEVGIVLPWLALIHLVTTVGFLFQHVPSLEEHLESKYGNEFRDRATRTAKFVPCV